MTKTAADSRKEAEKIKFEKNKLRYRFKEQIAF